jgi:hypothetical protein
MTRGRCLLEVLAPPGLSGRLLKTRAAFWSTEGFSQQMEYLKYRYDTRGVLYDARQKSFSEINGRIFILISQLAHLWVQQTHKY